MLARILLPMVGGTVAVLGAVAVLDELERRDPDGIARRIDTGGNPGGYLTSDR